MAGNNLRIIYENLVDLATTTITATTAASGAPVANLKSDLKGKVWQATSTSATLTVNFGSTVSVGGIILAFTNLPSTATIAVSGGYTASATLCSPWALSLQDWGTTPSGSSKYAYGYGTYARIWFTANTNVNSLTITITSSGSNIEVSRLIIGPYWSPVYNTGYGMSNTVQDLSINQRTESGDLISRRGPRFNTLQFDTQWLDATDRTNLRKLFLGNGIYKPIFVSLFPNDTDIAKEASHQIYGKLDQSPGVSYSTLNIYSTQFNVQEV